MRVIRAVWIALCWILSESLAFAGGDLKVTILPTGDAGYPYEWSCKTIVRHRSLPRGEFRLLPVPSGSLSIKSKVPFEQILDVSDVPDGEKLVFEIKESCLKRPRGLLSRPISNGLRVELKWSCEIGSVPAEAGGVIGPVSCQPPGEPSRLSMEHFLWKKVKDRQYQIRLERISQEAAVVNQVAEIQSYLNVPPNLPPQPACSASDEPSRP